MGYELHIVRLDDYTDGDEESKIPLNEWLAYVATDEEFELTNGYSLNLPGMAEEWHDAPGFCYWQGHPKSDVKVVPWFSYGNGSISAKYPDNDTIKKMITMATALNARVCGDDFEFYDETFFTNGGYAVGAEPKPVSNVVEKDKKPWWKVW